MPIQIYSTVCSWALHRLKYIIYKVVMNQIKLCVCVRRTFNAYNFQVCNLLSLQNACNFRVRCMHFVMSGKWTHKKTFSVLWTTTLRESVCVCVFVWYLIFQNSLHICRELQRVYINVFAYKYVKIYLPHHHSHSCKSRQCDIFSFWCLVSSHTLVPIRVRGVRIDMCK